MPRHHIFLTGVPGVGKTTLIKKIVKALQDKGRILNGFYTEELRENGSRTGFDVVSLDGSRSPLARIRKDATYKKQPTVGKYAVKLDEFERTAIPLLKHEVRADRNVVVVIDEVGKMELFSKVFQSKVSQLLNCSEVVVLGTIPVKKSFPIQFVEEIRQRADVRVFEITFQNRNNIFEEIINSLLV
ncbi:cancer-related nucleoside-triphosphatase homolog [Clavelina lepadiformis]|uniref:AAA+ ATPase domain-containing protein n=1 Tax=Clavelina lepadiformis TaxID=159417 RepID=A0ABP0GK09_CLALP